MSDNPRLTFNIFTLFPEMFSGVLGESILKRAMDKNLFAVNFINFRDWAEDRHQSVDDAPYGGGGGMVIRADVLSSAMDESIGKTGTKNRPKVYLMSPRGRRFDHHLAKEMASQGSIALVCGHYEAIDERFIESRVDEEVSLGDFVLTGGEIPAMAVIDAVVRWIPGVLGNSSSAVNETFESGMLEAPHYTRPELFEGRPVPDVLLSGDHQRIEEWRQELSLGLTRNRRPDLFEKLLLWPDQVVRIARRRRDFAVWRVQDDSIEVLLATSSVRALPNLEERLKRERGQKGLTSDIRYAEIRTDRVGGIDEEREEVGRELLYAGSPSQAGGYVSKEGLTLAERIRSEMGRQGHQMG